ncbi:MAG TPA: peroxiredoxin, partial [Nocardioidaceae bacterium]
GKDVSLSDYRGRKVIVYFYPAAMTPGCTTQACDFRDSLDSLAAAGYAVLGISPDAPDKLAKFRERDAVTFPLLSDATKSTLQAYDAYGEKTMYGKKVTGVLRSTFIVDPDGRIEDAQYNVKAKGHVAKLRRDLGVDD